MKKIPAFVLVLLKLFILILVLFTILRISWLVYNIDKLGEASAFEIIKAHLLGLRFDSIVAVYLLFLPFILFVVKEFLNKKWLSKVAIIWLTVLMGLTIFIAVADMPYYAYFSTHINASAIDILSGSDGGMIVSMILSDYRYLLLLIPIVALIYLICRLVKRIVNSTQPPTSIVWKVVGFVGMVVFMIYALRGWMGLRESPLVEKHAYFCNNNLLNQTAINPTGTLLRSILHAHKDANAEYVFMSDKDALQNIKQAYPNAYNKDYPLSRSVTFENERKNYNVVLVLMESMSWAKTAHGGNNGNLTPFLDSLMDKSLLFANCYSIGMHTHCGLYGTLYSYPTLFKTQPLNLSPLRIYNGLPNTLKREGYKTIYFTTHDPFFDNVGLFLTTNGIDKVVSEDNYPKEVKKGYWGVPDDYMFRYSQYILDKMSKADSPFFATFLTTSDHGPYYIPEYFKPRSAKQNEQATEYADWSLQQFMQMAKQQDWYENTIFVFVADHGAAMDSDYDLPLTYFHIPLLIYSPSGVVPVEVRNQMASQLDVFPTIMGLLNIPYINNTFGIDLLREERPYAYMMHDNKYGIIDQEYVYINNPETKMSGLYHYSNKDKTNYEQSQSAKVAEMKKYAETRWQFTQYLVRNNLTFLP